MLYIILVTPPLVNGLASTLAFGPVVERRKLVFLVTLTHFPRHNFLDFDHVAAWTHIVVVVEGNHTMYHFRVDSKLYQS
jgi:hypothetical protein